MSNSDDIRRGAVRFRATPYKPDKRTKHSTNSSPATDRLALSIQDCTVLTGLSRTTIYQEIASGRLATIRIGRRRLVMPEAIHLWLRYRTGGRWVQN